MQIIEYNKLIRDKIPEIIEAAGKTCFTRILSDEDYIKCLNKKLNEELEEYQESQNIEELADLLEVIYAIVKTRGITSDEFEKIRMNKADKRGQFTKKLFLEKVIE